MFRSKTVPINTYKNCFNKSHLNHVLDCCHINVCVSRGILEMKFLTPGPGIADAVVADWHVPCTRASAVSVLPACPAHHLPYHAAVCSARGCRPPIFKIASSTFFPISHNYSFHLQLLSLLNSPPTSAF